MGKISVKTAQELEKMVEGGRRLAEIKRSLAKAIEPGVSAYRIELLAEKLIEKAGGFPSFKMVPGYSWATCINVGPGLVHGIPKREIVFSKGDVVSVDVGMFYQGFHTDTSLTLGITPTSEIRKFLGVGSRALKLAISRAKAGNRIFDISQAIEDTIQEAGYSPIRALVGHGIGEKLHLVPQIPCFTQGRREDSPEIPLGATLAIEVMYAQGAPEVAVAPDGWTILMTDGKISALFEETVAVISRGPLVLTQ